MVAMTLHNLHGSYDTEAREWENINFSKGPTDMTVGDSQKESHTNQNMQNDNDEILTNPQQAELPEVGIYPNSG